MTKEELDKKRFEEQEELYSLMLLELYLKESLELRFLKM